MVEWVNCLLFDTILLIVEAAINLWMASKFAEVGLISQYRAIIVMLIVPSFANPTIWLFMRKKYNISGVFIFVLLLLGFPSPFFM